MDNSWWSNTPKKTEGNLTLESLRGFYDTIVNAVRQPHYYVCSPDHEKHKREVKVLLGLPRIPTKKSCPLCNKKSKQSQNSKREAK